MVRKDYFQISTAIDYPSGRFHLGHAYEKICTDVLARWKRLESYKVHFSTGTDCHGLKIERSAKKAGKSPLEFVKEISADFNELCKILNISYDDFVMTIEPRHKGVAQYILEQLYKKGDIYKGFYEGLYCVDCETYYTERELIENKCPIHKKPVEKIKEESYFFRLSKYQKFLIDYIKRNPNCIWPEHKRKEILNRLKEPLRDLSISRKQVKWGIPLPFDKDLTEFVWFEAVDNYLTTIGYPNEKYKKFWPALHVIGSDIIWHHTCLWFSILKSLGLKLPKVVVHGFINLKGEKLSKATGLRIDPLLLAQRYSTDALRYFLIREIPFGEDGDFSENALKQRANGELVKDLGNLLSRVISMAAKFKGKISGKGEIKLDLKKIKKHMDNFELHRGVKEIFNHIRKVNKYFNDKEPWKLKDRELGNVLYNSLENLRMIAILLEPFMPESSEKINKQLGVKKSNIKDCKYKKFNGKIKKGEYLFKKL